MLFRLKAFGTALAVAGLLNACSGAGNVAPTTLPQIPGGTQSIGTSPQGTAGARDALATARKGDSLHATLPVQPSSLKLTPPTPQSLTVTVKVKTAVFVASSDPKIATVSPDYVRIDNINNGSGTATFTVTPHAIGKAVIGLIDSQWMYAIVPVTVSAVKVGASKIYVANGDTVMTYNADGSASTPTITAGLTWASEVAVDATGRIYVVDSNENTVTTYNPDGTQTTPTLGATLYNPIDVAVDTAGKIYVVNYTFEYPTGSYTSVMTFTANGTPTTPTINPLTGARSVAVDAAGKIYVTGYSPDTGNSDIVTTYNTDGTPATPTITAGLNSPSAVAVDAAGKIYVANSGNNTVTTYNADGTRTTPTIRAGLNVPVDLAVDAAGKIYVANRGQWNGTTYPNANVTTYRADGTASTPTITGVVPYGITVH